jgi:hypothetical protein
MRLLHNQFPTSALTDEEYETALVHLSEQIGAQIVARYPEGEAYKAASDALANTCQTSADQTILGWIESACAAVGASADNCIGL